MTKKTPKTKTFQRLHEGYSIETMVRGLGGTSAALQLGRRMRLSPSWIDTLILHSAGVGQSLSAKITGVRQASAVYRLRSVKNTARKRAALMSNAEELFAKIDAGEFVELSHIDAALGKICGMSEGALRRQGVTAMPWRLANSPVPTGMRAAMRRSVSGAV